MDADHDDAQLAERMLHARVEVLLRDVIQRGISQLVARDHQPVVVLDASGEHDVRWLRAGTDADLLGAVAAELDAVAAGCLLVEERRQNTVVGVAVTVSAGGARSLQLDVTRRRLGRARIVSGLEEVPSGTARQVAAALQGAVVRTAHRASDVRRAADPPVA